MKNEHRISLTVVIPFYNRRIFIEEKYNKFKCIENKIIEFIFINDGSTEDFDFLRPLENIIVVTNAKNLGVQKSRNIGMNLAKGSHVIFFDSDDIFYVCAVEEILRVNIDFFGYCKPRVFWDGVGYKRDSLIKSLFFSIYKPISKSPVPTSFLIFKKSFLLENRISFDPDLPSCQDDDIYIVCSQFADPKYLNKLCWGGFLNHSSERISSSKNYLKGRMMLTEKHCAIFKSNLPKFWFENAYFFKIFKWL